MLKCPSSDITVNAIGTVAVLSIQQLLRRRRGLKLECDQSRFLLRCRTFDLRSSTHPTATLCTPNLPGPAMQFGQASAQKSLHLPLLERTYKRRQFNFSGISRGHLTPVGIYVFLGELGVLTLFR